MVYISAITDDVAVIVASHVQTLTHFVIAALLRLLVIVAVRVHAPPIVVMTFGTDAVGGNARSVSTYLIRSAVDRNHARNLTASTLVVLTKTIRIGAIAHHAIAFATVIPAHSL